MAELQNLREEKEVQLQLNHDLQAELRMIKGEKEEQELELTTLQAKLKETEQSTL